MKKVIIFLFIIICLYTVLISENNEVLIPTESIRMRIIANSNEVEDQINKINLKESLEQIILNIEADSSNIEESRKNIEKSIPLIEEKLISYNLNYDINIGSNYFPEKNYKGVIYEEGNYESIVITIGEGEGDNWWCVLFPPLCLVEEQNDEIQYSLYVKNIINRFK